MLPPVNSIFFQSFFQWNNLSRYSIKKCNSDHIRSFTLVLPHILSNVLNRKNNILESDWSKFKHVKFILDYFLVDWPHTQKFQNNNNDTLFQNFFDSMNNILNKHAPCKKIGRYKLKFRIKPCITEIYF